jgi:collagen type VI alpha
MILLTDGRSNPRPIEDAIAEAQAARDRGVLIFAIGLGTDLDVDGLRQIASRPEYFYQSPDSTDLTEIYERIAGAIPCPPTDFWGRR